MIVIGCPNTRKLAKKIAKKTKSKYSDLTVKHFPDGELYVKFETNVKRQEVVLVQTLHPVKDIILELLLAAYTAKELGARRVTLVIPYLAYIRQDKRFNPGEAVSSKIIGKLLSPFTKIITIDPHLHRFKSLTEVFDTRTKKLSANDLIKKHIKKKFKDPIVIGPDSESYQWAKEIADDIGAHAAIMEKTRYSSRNVKEILKSPIEVKGKDVVIIDDILSTGKTILEAINKIKKHKPKAIHVVAIHGIFADLKTYKKIKKLTKSITTTNTIENIHSKIDVSELISSSLK